MTIKTTRLKFGCLANMKTVCGWVGYRNACIAVVVFVDISRCEVRYAYVESLITTLIRGFKSGKASLAYIGKTVTKTITITAITYIHHHFFMCPENLWKRVSFGEAPLSSIFVALSLGFAIDIFWRSFSG